MKKPAQEKISPQIIKEEKLRDIGNYLQKLRQDQGVSLETISQNTRIPLRLLIAIETGNLTELPEDIYIRAFIKEFANYLGENGEDLANQFPLINNFQSRKRYFWLPLFLPSIQLRPIHLYLFYILLVFFSVRAIADFVEPNNNVQVIQIETDSQSQNQPSTPKKPVSPPKKNQPSTTDHLTVEIKVEESSWLRVVVDGKTTFEGIVTKGTQKTWVANQKLTIRAGNAGAVLVAYNEQKPQQLGKLGQVEEVTYTR